VDADDNKAIGEAIKRTWGHIETFEKFPDIDLFDEFK